MNQTINILPSLHSGPAIKSNRLNRPSSLFLSFIVRNRVNRVYAEITVLGTIIQFAIFKTLYPFPDFIQDSYNYIDTASQHLSANVLPIGYGKFLGLIHLINSSDTLLIAFQYFFMEAALAYLFFSILYLFLTTRYTRIIIFIFFFFNPLFLFLSNCILPDAFFITLSIVFLVQFLWIYQYPNLSRILIQGILIGLAFTLKYTAIYYPLLSIIGLLPVRIKPMVKGIGILLGIILILSFILYTTGKTKQLTGTAQFSIFGGWQLANNALYFYEHVQVDSTRLPRETRVLDYTTQQFFKIVSPEKRDLTAFGGSFFIIAPYGPLRQYMAQQYRNEDGSSPVKILGNVSPVMESYGKSLISCHPAAFFRYFILPNTRNYFLPHLEKMETYNMMQTGVPLIVQDWFGYITSDLWVISNSFQGKLFRFYPILFLLLNVLFIICLLASWLSGEFKKQGLEFRYAIVLVTNFLILYAIFYVVTVPVVLRFQVIPMILLLPFSLLLTQSKKENI